MKIVVKQNVESGLDITIISGLLRKEDCG